MGYCKWQLITTSCIMDNNGFTGKIPSNIERLSKLLKIQLAHNKLTGGIPFFHSSATGASFPELLVVDLSYNNLTGFFPISLTLLGAIQIIDVSKNNFQGGFPSSLYPLLDKTRLNYVDVSGNFLTGSVDNVSISGVKVNVSNNCFKLQANQRPPSVCAAQLAPPCNTTEDIRTCNNLGGDYEQDCNYAFCNDTSARCQLSPYDDGDPCGTPIGEGHSYQCSNLTCLAGKCTFQNVRTPVINHTCTDVAQLKLGWSVGCFDARCASNGSCTLRRVYNTSKDCQTSNSGQTCSSTFCNGAGLCNLHNNYTDGAKCVLADTDYQCANTTCLKGDCVATYNGRTSCAPYVYTDQYGQTEYRESPLYPCTIHTCNPATRMCSNIRSAPNTTVCSSSPDGCDDIHTCDGVGGCDYSKYHTAANGTACGPQTGPFCSKGACRLGQCQPATIYPNGTICDTLYNPNGGNAIDDQCLISSCIHGECTNIVGNKPAGTVCLPPAELYDHPYIFGTCESDECCAHCDGAGKCDRDIRDGQSCTKCTTSFCGEGSSGCEPNGCSCVYTSCGPNRY
eukprot:SM000244S08554  [mRNA]  locus=s244:23702:30065:- [translate_table: standard]